MFNYIRNKLCLVDTIKQLKLEVHNQQQFIEVLERELENYSEKLSNKEIELFNLNKYSNELEHKLNQIKALIN